MPYMLCKIKGINLKTPIDVIRIRRIADVMVGSSADFKKYLDTIYLQIYLL
jgi:hypothetical protein